MGQGLEPDLEGNFAYPKVGVEQQVLRFLDANSGDIISKVYPGDLFEHLAKIERGGIDGAGNMAEAQVLGLMFLDKIFGPGNDRWFGILVLDDDLVTQH